MYMAHLLGIAPDRAHLTFELDHRIRSNLLRITDCCRPAAKISRQFRKSPRAFQLQLWSWDLGEWERNILIRLVDDLALRRPIRTDDDLVVVLQNVVQRRMIQDGIAINGCNKQCARRRD